MTELKQIYKCKICGNVVEMVHPGAGKLVCCGQDMNLLVGNTFDAAVEKHLPVIEKTDGGFRVKIGEVSHPMETEHFIEWIEVLTEDRVFRSHLAPGQEPIAYFNVEYKGGMEARAYCNLHGLWQSDGANNDKKEIAKEEIALSN